MGSGSEDDDVPVELKTGTGFIRRTSPKPSNSPGPSKAKSIDILDGSATGASLDPFMQTRELNVVIESDSGPELTGPIGTCSRAKIGLYHVESV